MYRCFIATLALLSLLVTAFGQLILPGNRLFGDFFSPMQPSNLVRPPLRPAPLLDTFGSMFTGRPTYADPFVRRPLPPPPVVQCRLRGACNGLDHGTTLPTTWRVVRPTKAPTQPQVEVTTRRIQTSTTATTSTATQLSNKPTTTLSTNNSTATNSSAIRMLGT